MCESGQAAERGHDLHAVGLAAAVRIFPGLGVTGPVPRCRIDGRRYANRLGAAVFSFLRTVVMNLLRPSGHRSIRQGFRELAYAIKGMLALGGVATAPSTS